ncbi:MAG: GNAT family N-acetyltransferase [Rubrobacteraceae bacterium]
MNVREAGEKDAEGIHALACELADAIGDAPPFPETVRARLLELLEEPRAGVLVAEMGGDLVGAASFWIKPDLAHGDTVAEVPMLAVLEEYRREGIGQALMGGVRRRAAEFGAGLIELVATPANVAAREFYRSLGFVETDHVVLELVGDIENAPDERM